MKVARLHGVHDLRLHDEPDPAAPSSGQAVLRITSIGVCGSDLHWFAESGIGDARLARPLVLGHEFAGVALTGQYKGQRVAVDPAIACGECEFCVEGNPNFCANMHFAGHGGDDGAMRECIAWPEHLMFPLPDSINDADGAMLEPLGVAIHAVDLGHVRPGMSVAVFGNGPIGLLTLQMARLAGAAEKLGAPVIRVFAGKEVPAGFTRTQVVEWMAKDLQECAEFGEKHGVMVGIQNHNDFLKTSGDIEELLSKINSKWFGLILDIGSLRTTDNPYKEIEQVVPYAINWQIKETVFINNVETKTDLKKIVAILKSSRYRGYIPIETLGAGDPKEKVARFFNEVKNAVEERPKSLGI